MVCHIKQSLSFSEVYLFTFSLFADFHLNYLNSSQKVLIAFVMFLSLAAIAIIRFLNPKGNYSTTVRTKYMNIAANVF